MHKTYVYVLTSAINWILFLPKFTCSTLPPHMVVFWDETFGSWLGHEGGALINRISAFIKNTP